MRKGVFPWKYIDNWDESNDTQLPPQKFFLSKLNNSSISNDNYEHAINAKNLI